MHSSSLHYRQFQPEDRMILASLQQQIYSIKTISRVRHRSPSTVGKTSDLSPDFTDLLIYSQVQLDTIAYEINGRPRKRLGVRSPLAVYRELLINIPQHSTLVH